MTREQLIEIVVPHLVEASAKTHGALTPVAQIEADIRKDIAAQVTTQSLQDTYNNLRRMGKITNDQLLAAVRMDVQQQQAKTEESERKYFEQACDELHLQRIDANFQVIRRLTLKIPTGPHEGEWLSWRHTSEIAQLMSAGEIRFARTAQDEQRAEQEQKLTMAKSVLASLTGQFWAKHGIIGPSMGVFGAPGHGQSKADKRAKDIEALCQLPVETLNRLLNEKVRNHVAHAQAQEASSQPQSQPQQQSMFLPLPKTTRGGEVIDAAYLVRLANENFQEYKHMWVKR